MKLHSCCCVGYPTANFSGHLLLNYMMSALGSGYRSPINSLACIRFFFLFHLDTLVVSAWSIVLLLSFNF